MSTPTGELCRITVVGPDRRADVAVPSTTPVATLLPLLLREWQDVDPPRDAWVLQRLGERPFDLSGTPESLDWLEGEELYLRPAENPLPELDFDDLAEGVATVVNRRGDRWQPEYRRILFLLLATMLLGAIAAVLMDRGTVLSQVITAAVFGGTLMAAAVVSGRLLADTGFNLLLAGGAAGFGALASAAAVDGDPRGIAVTTAAVLAAAVTVTGAAALLVLAQRTISPYLPFTPLTALGTTALAAVGIILLRTASQLTMHRSAAIGMAVIFVMVVAAPRVAVKFGRLRGPQLPKTGEDMSFDIEPNPSEQVHGRTRDADAYLTVAMVVAVILPVLFHFTVGAAGWSGWTLVLAVSCAVLLRARNLLGVWQRGALVAAGTAGVLQVVWLLAGKVSPGWWWTMLAALMALLVPLLFAALRAWPRRMLPMWEFTARFLDVTTGLAVLPVMGQVLGIYGWARGLFG